MTRKILWLDDDLGYLRPYTRALAEWGFSVSATRSPLQAEVLLSEQDYELLILDVLIPTTDLEEERIYSPFKTDFGHQTGLLFFKRAKSQLVEAGTATLVLTNTVDSRIAKQFIKEGLAPENFARKTSLIRIPDFKDKVFSLLKEGAPC